MFGNKTTAQPHNVVWRPLPGSQVLALSAPVNHILYEGTRGPGKTDTQLFRFRRRVGLGYGKFWRGIIFDRQYRNLEDLIAKSQRWFGEFDDGASYSGAGGGGRWKWPSGEELMFRHIRRPSDYWLYHGHEYPFMGWNELSKYPTSELYDIMMSCNRTSFRPEDYPLPDGRLLPEIPLEVFSTTNPFGPGHAWVKERFIDVAEPGQVVRKVINVFNPRTQERVDVVKTQVRIFGSYKENRYLNPEYVAELESINDPEKRKAWLWGDWNINSGGALEGVWTDAAVVPRFQIPKDWRVDRAFDWGSTHPFSVGWWAEANGEEVLMPDGTTRVFQPGTLIRLNEWYGTEKRGTNKGLKLSARSICEGIKERESNLKKSKWIAGKPQPGPADTQIYNTNEQDVDSIGNKMEEEGVIWTRAVKTAGSRIVGLQLVRDRLEANVTGEGPGLMFMDHCRDAIATLPTLPRDEENPDDVDTTAEDHIYDEVRYRVLAANIAATSLSKLRVY